MSGEGTAPSAMNDALDTILGATLRIAMRHAQAESGWSVRRFGFEFGKTPLEVPASDIGKGPVEIVERVTSLVRDTNMLVCIAEGEDAERELGADDLPMLFSALAAARVFSAKCCPHCGGNLSDWKSTLN